MIHHHFRILIITLFLCFTFGYWPVAFNNCIGVIPKTLCVLSCIFCTTFGAILLFHPIYNKDDSNDV